MPIDWLSTWQKLVIFVIKRPKKKEVFSLNSETLSPFYVILVE